jgi:hypothetical protein
VRGVSCPRAADGEQIVNRLFVIGILLRAASAAQASPFVNLDFEQANVPAGTGQTLNAGLALPGWTARVNNSVLGNVYYDYAGIGEPFVALYDRPDFFGPGFIFLDGRFDVAMGGNAGVPALIASIAQSGDVPGDARSVRFVTDGLRPPPVVAMDGTDLQSFLISTTYRGFDRVDTYAVDVTAFAGASRELRFSTLPLCAFDTVSFSTSPVPEPVCIAGILVAAAPFLVRRRRRSP